MFSFIKALERFFSNLKAKKGLWFTILTIVSILGITTSMYLLGSMTESIAKDVYVNMSKTYTNKLDTEISDKQKELKKMSLALKLNNRFISNLNNPIELNPFIDEYNGYLESNGFNNLKIYYYSTVSQINQYRTSINTVINRKEASYGFEIVNDGPSLVYLEPIVLNGNILGILEVRDNLFSLKADLERNSGLFLFLLEEKMLPNLSIDFREGKYRTVIDTLKIEESRYDGQFFGSIIEEGKDLFDALKSDGFVVNEEYFKTSKRITDINGVQIGYIILGEKVGKGAFVSIVDNMTKSVTMVALGLVISILIFMF